jgi:hypothetical protein
MLASDLCRLTRCPLGRGFLWRTSRSCSDQDFQVPQVRVGCYRIEGLRSWRDGVEGSSRKPCHLVLRFEIPSARLRRTPVATAVRYDRRIGRIVIDLSSGLEVAFRANDAQGLEHAKPSELSKIEITPSGLGIHFPLLDADLYLPALLEGFLGSRRWMAAQMGKAGGKVSTKAKAAASRRNGKLGGRPRKLRA